MRMIWRAGLAVALAIGFVALVEPIPADAATSIALLRNDYTRDGISDLVGVRGADGCLNRWRGNGNGTFTEVGILGCGWEQYRDLTGLGDFNRDGIGDLVAIRRSDGCLARWRGTGNFGFRYIGDAGCGWEQYRALAGSGDLNGDGVADLIAIRDADGCVARWFGTGGSGFNYVGDFLCYGTFAPSHLEGVGDINGDGNADVIAVFGTGCVITYKGNGQGWYFESHYQCELWGSEHGRNAVGMGSIDGDTIGDLVTNAFGCIELWHSSHPWIVPFRWLPGGQAGCGLQGYTVA